MRILKENDYKTFEKIAMLSQDSLKSVMTNYLKGKYKEVVSTKEYVYAKGDIPIGLVAHLDTVFSKPPVDIFYDTRKNVMWSPEGLGADDRAGVFAIIKILQSGLRPNIILTTDEEIGGIGASELAKLECPFEDLRYLIQLDRRGTNDCVFYDCDNGDFVEYVEQFGFIESWGSFSDISVLCPSWGVAGVNLSVGYRNEHSTEELLYISPLLSTIDKVKKMLSEKDIPSFVYIPTPYSFRNWNWRTGYDYGAGNSYLYAKCPCCGKNFAMEELVPVTMLDGSIIYVCSDCVLDPINNIEFCDSCYEAFEYADEDGWIPAFCPKCRNKAIAKGAI